MSIFFAKRRDRSRRSTVQLSPVVEGLEGRVALSTMSGHNAAVEIKDFSFNVASQGAGAAKVKFNPFSLKHHVSAAGWDEGPSEQIPFVYGK